MRKTNTLLRRFTKKLRELNALQAIALSLLCATGAFTLGLESAGEVDPFEHSKAAVIENAETVRVSIKGDVDGNERLDVRDAAAVLAFADALDEPTPEQVKRGDMDGDYRLTTKDVMRILHSLSTR